MTIDNELYNRLSTTWWNENEALGILRSWFGSTRFGYFRRVLVEECMFDPYRRKVLDVGCGGGLLAEEFARLSCCVTGIDPSEASLITAREHAVQSGLSIDYISGVGENLPFADGTFDIVVCCDVLEHVNDVKVVIREIARVLRPGGIFFYDTINRTFLSWLAHIKLAQDCPFTRFMPPHLHDWQKFIQPRELLSFMKRAGLNNQDVKGISPAISPVAVIGLFIQQKRGDITLAKMGEIIGLHESDDLSTSYMGYALKRI